MNLSPMLRLLLAALSLSIAAILVFHSSDARAQQGTASRQNQNYSN